MTNAGPCDPALTASASLRSPDTLLSKPTGPGLMRGSPSRQGFVHVQPFDELISEFAHRPRSASDGVPEGVIASAEAKLGFRLPADLRTMLLRIGRWEVLRAHNVLFEPTEFEEKEDRVVFMDENQSVVSWGMKRDSPDSNVWQRNNTDGAWYSEELDLRAFLRSMLEWYRANQAVEFR